MALDRRNLLASIPVLLSSTVWREALAASGESAGPSAATVDSGDAGSGVSMQLARFVAQTNFDALPADAVVMAKRAILDAIGVSLAAAALEPACRPFTALALEAGSPAQSTVIGTGRRTSMVLAALANGALAHAIDYEDSHEASRTHPNAASIAAALAVAEGLGNVSGEELLAAVVLGCDVVCRLALAQIEGSGGERRVGFYPPAIVGTFGAVTAASKLLKLDAQQTLDAFSLALCQNSCSGEILNSPDSDIRAVRDGMCAQAGVMSALLAKRGVKGFDKPFEGQAGYFTMYWNGKYSARALTAALGNRFEIRDVAFKPWASCRDTHLYIQAALELMAAHPIDVDRIATILVRVAPRNLIVCEPAVTKRRPRTSIDAKFSVYYTVAAALVHGQVVLSSFSDDARADERVLACAAKVSYRIDPDQARSLAEGGGIVLEIVMQDGVVHRQSVKALAGSIDSPMSESELVEKFIDCGLQAKGRRSRVQLQALSTRILSLEGVADVGDMVRQL